MERKCLSHYLQILLGDETLLKTLYKRYAFLRCEDEREQSLFHLQTLNTVDFSCFTNAYSKSAMLYQVATKIRENYIFILPLFFIYVQDNTTHPKICFFAF